MTLFTPFLKCPSISKCSKIIFSSRGNNYSNAGATTWSPKAEHGILSLNTMQEMIIKVITQFLDGSPIEPKGVHSKWCNECDVLTREKCKIIWSDWGDVLENEKEALLELIKAHYGFPFEHEELGKRATIFNIGRALQRFIQSLNRFYVQLDVSPLNQFRFIIPNEWNTFQQLHTTPEAITLRNRMKEII
jgi:hypothetical protein